MVWTAGESPNHYYLPVKTLAHWQYGENQLEMILWKGLPGAQSMDEAWMQLPVGCQSHDSSVEIRNKWEINYLTERNGSHAQRSEEIQAHGEAPAGADGSSHVKLCA